METENETEKASKSIKILHSAAIYYSTFAYGCGYTFLSPAVIALSRQFGTDVSQISIVFTVITVSYLSSALLCGFLYNVLNRQLVMISLISLMSTSLFIIPFVSNLTLFYVLGGILGFGCGGYDVGQVAEIIKIWSGEASLYILIQHFAYSIGTILPPLILGPFLPKDHEFKGSQAKNLVIPFCIAGFILGVAVLIHLALFFVFRTSLKRPINSKGELKLQENASAEGKETMEIQTMETTTKQRMRRETCSGWQLSDRCRTILLTFLSCVIIGPYRGMELTTMQYLTSFSVYSKVHLTEYEGAKVLFSLNLAYALGRGLGIPLVLKYSPQKILFCNFIFIFISNTILLVASQDSITWLYVGSIGFGLGLSTIFGCYYSYIEKFFFVSHTVVSVITVSDGILASIYPLVVGRSVEMYPAILPSVNFFSMTILFISFGVTYWLTKLKKL